MSASVVDDVSCPSIHCERIRNALQIITASRRLRKNLKGKHEAVWTPSLEAALLEGLDSYRPKISSRPFLRFPDRNIFISDYIFRATGKVRTSKQVGSRLQQLRDTVDGKRILEIFSSRHEPGGQSTTTSPQSSTSDISLSLDPNRDVVCIDVLPADFICHKPVEATPLFAALPRTLSAIDPTVTFAFSTNICALSVCVVYFNDSPVYREVTPLTCTPTLSHEGSCVTGCTYSVALVPGFWGELCRSNNLGQYSIIQEIMQVPSSFPPSNSPAASVSNAAVLCTVEYKFNEVAFLHSASSLSSIPPFPHSTSSGSQSSASSLTTGMVDEDGFLVPAAASYIVPAASFGVQTDDFLGSTSNYNVDVAQAAASNDNAYTVWSGAYLPDSGRGRHFTSAWKGISQHSGHGIIQ